MLCTEIWNSISLDYIREELSSSENLLSYVYCVEILMKNVTFDVSWAIVLQR